MRVVKEIPGDQYNLTIYSWNNKYLLKFEQGSFEQTYKISEFDVLVESDLDVIVSDAFVEKVIKRFEEMNADFSEAVQPIL
ncbi:MAG: hypothetical protein NXI20_17080 [bacterium]|nr:hypothetical protein [bacterium]